MPPPEAPRKDSNSMDEIAVSVKSDLASKKNVAEGFA